VKTTWLKKKKKKKNKFKAAFVGAMNEEFN
jgi:hypothetical protein